MVTDDMQMMRLMEALMHTRQAIMYVQQLLDSAPVEGDMRAYIDPLFQEADTLNEMVRQL